MDALETGIALAGELADQGISLIAIGDMGIGNTTSASALTSVFCGVPPEDVAGLGTGLDAAGVLRKITALQKGLAVNRPDPGDALDTLAKVGGFEIAGMAGVVLEAAARKVPVLMDGFISTAAAMVAVRLEPKAAAYLIASHRSVEIGHRVLLQSLGKRPLLELDLRLGEGTGAALAMGLVDAAVRILHEMATFETAGVTDAGR
jgi:nicotinate-nucleotide--dimethylbenzimidazole phosphoribosyltransferase